MVGYICPAHYIPQTYGEASRSDGSEVERGRMLKANGKPEPTNVLTVAIMDWVYEIETGKRCWYCGALKP